MTAKEIVRKALDVGAFVYRDGIASCTRARTRRRLHARGGPVRTSMRGRPSAKPF